MKIKVITYFNHKGGMDHYKKIFCLGYKTDSFSFFSDNYWLLFFQIMFGLKNNFLKKKIDYLKNYDAIHFTDNVAFSYFVIKFFLKNSNLKIVHTIHDPIPHSEKKIIKKISRVFNIIVNKSLSYLSLAYPKRFYLHIHSKALLTNYLKKNKNLIIQSHPISIVNKNVKDIFDISNKFVVGFVGRVEYYKGIDILLEAILKLDKYVSKSSNIEVIIAGRGNYKFSIPDTKNIKVNRFDRFVSNDELDSIIKYSSIIILPYRDATASGVLTRVIAHNTPVIVSDKGCLPDYVDPGVNGFIYKKESELENIILKSLNYKFCNPSLDFSAKSICKSIINNIK